MLGVRIEPELERRLEAIAAKTGRSKSYYVRRAIQALIEEWEDAAAAIAVLEKPGRRWPMEEVERALDLIEKAKGQSRRAAASAGDADAVRFIDEAADTGEDA